MTSGNSGDGVEDEELRHGTDRLPPRLRRPATVVLVAVAGLAVAWVTTRIDSGGGRSADPTSSASASPSPSASPSRSTTFSASGLVVVPVPSGSDIVVVPVTPSAPSVSPIPTCASGVRCATSVALPAAVGAALRDNYPGARIVSSRTITRTVADRTSLVGRSVTAVAGARRFEITVGPYVLGSDDFNRTNDADTSTVSVDAATALADQTVHMLLTEPTSARPNDLIVLRLARDPRLSALR